MALTAAPWLLVLAGLTGAACTPTLDPVGTSVGVAGDGGAGGGRGSGTTEGTVAGQIETCAWAATNGEESVYWTLRSQTSAPEDAGAGPAIVPGAQGGYLHLIPISGTAPSQEFSQPGVAVIRCSITVRHPGIYTVWARAYATGVGVNSLYVGIDDLWPASGRALQVCDRPGTFDRWTWTSNQYRNDADSCLGPGAITLMIAAPGPHTLMFSAREEGFRLDAWVLTLDRRYDPNAEAAYPVAGL